MAWHQLLVRGVFSFPRIGCPLQGEIRSGRHDRYHTGCNQRDWEGPPRRLSVDGAATVHCQRVCPEPCLREELSF